MIKGFFDKKIDFPELSRINDKSFKESTSGFCLKNCRVYSTSKDEGEPYLNQAVVLRLSKSLSKDVKYLIEETDEEMVITYKWKEYELPKINLEEWDIEFEGIV